MITNAVVAAALTIFNGCQKEELTVRQLTDEVQPQEVVQPDVSVENGYLAFKNIEVVDSIIHLLNKMTTSEKATWENQLGFKSARAEFDALFEEYDNLPTYEAFLAFKEKYNVEKGDVFVYPQLRLKSTYNEDDLIHDFPEDNPYVPYYSDRWHKINGISDRRLNNELRINRYRYYEFNYQTNQYDWVRGYNVYFKQRGQKKSWLGSWKDYKTTYIFDDLAVKVGNEPTSEFNPYSPVVSPEVKPHATIGLYWFVYRMPDPGIPNYVPPLLAIPDVSISILTSFRGFGVEALYNVDHIEHSGFPGTSFPYNPAPDY
ncbi:MAG TPA: hypothetical protein PLZ52_12380 [Bacteroidales bacterium]|jgi:hypothetical protein|nr:hypothetical protein [Bacteroidales bacterium]